MSRKAAFVWHRSRMFLVSAAGFTSLFAVALWLIHTALVMPAMAYRLWGQPGIHGWVQTVQELLGYHAPGQGLARLFSMVKADALTGGQLVLARVIAGNPGRYWQFLRWYLGFSLGFFYLAARFVHNLMVVPLTLKWSTRIESDMVQQPDWVETPQEIGLVVGMQHRRRDTALIHRPVLLRLGLSSLRTGMIVTGTTGTGKTYGALYSYTRQLLRYRPEDPDLKPGFLILDVKGNYCDQVMEFIVETGRMDDAIIIELGGAYRYNPLHKPHLRPQVLANRLRIILETFSAGKGQETYWLDKAEALIAEAVKLARLRTGYVSFTLIDRLIRKKEYRQFLEDLEQKEAAGLMPAEERAMLATARDFFRHEFEACDERVRSIIESEVTRMTGAFTADPLIARTFCAPREELNFPGFDDLIDSGRIVMLRMNAEEYQNLARILSTYLKLDFQSAVMTRLVRPGANRVRPVLFINDEYHFMASRTDGRFFSVCREANCINIVATQSFTSLIESLGDKTVVEAILQNLVNKIWLRSDDHYTIEMAQRATGREIQYRRSESITESGKDSNYSWLFGRSVAKNSNLSKSVNYQAVDDHVFPYDLFRQGLRLLTGVAFLYTGAGKAGNGSDISTTVIHLIPFDRLPRFDTKRSS